LETLLITGITGFIGKNVARLLVGNYQITALIRPNTDKKRYQEFANKIEFVEIDLTDTRGLREYLFKKSFKYILHIGALRGGRKFTKEDYLKANVYATEQLVLHAVKHQSKMIFCSSVGVFGAIPIELPANNLSPKQEDNYYHFTKIKSEAIIQKYVLEKGLNACILRPAITYGGEDYGFPFTLMKLIKRKLLVYPKRSIRIHMTHIDLISEAFIRVLKNDFKAGSQWNVADDKPVVFDELVQFISNKINQRPYPPNRRIDKGWFELGERISLFFKSELWVSRFELISKSWYYDVEATYRDLNLKKVTTVPGFKKSIDWYMKREKR